MKSINYSHRIGEMNEIAKLSGGKILDEEWKGVSHRYSFELGDGTLVKMLYRNIIKRGLITNVVKTYTDSQRLQRLKDIAIKNGGQLLSSKWMGLNKEHKFSDISGLVFYSTPTKIWNGTWSPDRRLISEPACRQVLEHLFNYKFPKNKDVLTAKLTNRKKALELDGYCQELKIAFEYQGHSSHWDTSSYKHEEVNKRDELKKLLCQKLGVVLIQIPRFENKKDKWNSKVIYKNVLNEIIKTYKDLNISLPLMNSNEFSLNLSQIHYGNEMLTILKETAKKNEAVLISPFWQGASYQYEFMSKDGVIFNLSYKNFKANGWPKDLDKYINLQLGHKKDSSLLLKDLRDVAQKNGGKLISTEWKGVYTKMIFESKEGKQFFSTPNNLRGGWPK